MKFFHNMYVSEALASRTDELILKIKQNIVTPNIYVITFASNPKNLLDIVLTRELLQPAYPKEDVKIIGLARGKKDAFALVEHIIGETYEKTGQFDVRAYLAGRQEGEGWT